MKTPTVIGEGTYGCVHKPTLKCKRGKHNYTHKVSKIMKKRHAKEEMREYRIIDKVDKAHKYYLGKPEECEPNDDPVTKRAIEKCSDAELYRENARLLIMEDGGLNLKDFSHEIGLSKERMEAFWIEARRMILALKDMIQHKVIHHDMKPENVVYDESKRRINLIDFGFMTTFSKIRSESMRSRNWLSQMHWSYPPEIHFYDKNTFLKYAGYSPNQKRMFVDSMIRDVREKRKTVFGDSWGIFFHYVLKEGNRTQETGFFKEFEEMMLLMRPSEYTSFLKRSMLTIDLYGLGIAFQYVLNQTGHLLDPSLKRDFADLFSRMISSNVFERIMVDDLLREYDEILSVSLVGHI